MTQKPEDRDGVMRLSHRLVAMHITGVAILILVVLSSVFWVSAEHNKLALESSESMVRGGIASFRARLRTLVRDYSIWDEAYEAVITDDRDWLYSNIGNAAAEIGTLDLIAFVPRLGGPTYGWREGSVPEGVPDPLPADAARGSDDAARRRRGRQRGVRHAAGRVRGRPLGVLDRPRDAGGRAAGRRPAGRPAAADSRAAALARAPGQHRSQPAGRRADAGRRPVRGAGLDRAARQRRAGDPLCGLGAAAPGRQHPAAGGAAPRAGAPPDRRRQRRQLGLCGALGPAARTGALRRQGGRPQQDRVPLERQPRAQDADERHPRRGAAPADHPARRGAEGARLGALRVGDGADGADLRPARHQPDGERQPPARQRAVRAGGDPEGRHRDDPGGRRQEGDRLRQRLVGGRGADGARRRRGRSGRSSPTCSATRSSSPTAAG